MCSSYSEKNTTANCDNSFFCPSVFSLPVIVLARGSDLQMSFFRMFIPVHRVMIYALRTEKSTPQQFKVHNARTTLGSVQVYLHCLLFWREAQSYKSLFLRQSFSPCAVEMKAKVRGHPSQTGSLLMGEVFPQGYCELTVFSRVSARGLLKFTGRKQGWALTCARRSHLYVYRIYMYTET